MAHEIVKRHLNQSAKKVAIVQLFVYLCVGYFLKIMGNFYGDIWKTEAYATMHAYLRAAHVHGLTLAFTLLFYGFLIEFAGISEKTKKVGVTLAILGMVLMPVSLVMFAFKLPALVLSHVAVVMILASVAMLVWAHLKKI
jgi:hypothetical protein